MSSPYQFERCRSIQQLRRVSPEAYAWFNDQAIPGVTDLLSQLVDADDPEALQLAVIMLDNWPAVTTFAPSSNQRYPLTLAGNRLSVRPLREPDLAQYDQAIATLKTTRFEDKHLHFHHPLPGVNTPEGTPLSILAGFAPQLSEWKLDRPTSRNRRPQPYRNYPYPEE